MNKFECDLSFIVYSGINRTLDKAIEENYKDGIEELEKAVKYYIDKFVLSGQFLIDKLET